MRGLTALTTAFDGLSSIFDHAALLSRDGDFEGSFCFAAAPKECLGVEKLPRMPRDLSTTEAWSSKTSYLDLAWSYTA